jgi:methylmalonyl-CoA mutase
LVHALTSVSMTINGPAMLLGFYECSNWSTMWLYQSQWFRKVEAKLKIYKEKLPRPVYNGDLPAGNDGLGLYLLGVTGDQVCPRMFIMNKSKNFHKFVERFKLIF